METAKGWRSAVLFVFHTGAPQRSPLAVKQDFVIIFPSPTWEGFVKKIIVASLISLILVACSNIVQLTPSATPMPLAAVTPTLSPLPSSETSEGQPASNWNGIPIMPGAIAGEGDEEGYVFTIKATPIQVKEYYQLELGKLGWQPFAQEDGDLSMTLIFMDGASATLTVSILSGG
jgi:hypothetical protein